MYVSTQVKKIFYLMGKWDPWRAPEKTFFLEKTD